MGKAIEEIAHKRSHSITCKISSQNLIDFNPRVLQWADVAIEFSTPEAAFNNVAQCIRMGIPVVSGTTGWLNRKDEIDNLCKELNGSFLYASNFSIGVNILFELNRLLSKIVDKYEIYDINIEETHHVSKIDKPSGTAITLAQDIIESTERKKVWTISDPNKKNPRSINIDSFRVDDVPGTHIVKYTSHIDDIIISHVAHNREGFATGALLAAEWILNKKGVFTMRDVLI